jgi:hypothetical protein
MLARTEPVSLEPQRHRATEDSQRREKGTQMNADKKG